MADKLKKAQKIALGELLAKGHRAFGKVAPRRPYRDEDDEGGDTGAARLLFEQHPLLANQPIGAASDLTFIISENRDTFEEAEKRSDQAAPELKKALEQKLQLGKQRKATPTPKPQPL